MALLYSAVKHIIKPLVEKGHSISGIANYLTLDNLWFRDNACFLILCKRKEHRSMYKTEQAGRLKHRTYVQKSENNKSIEQIVMS